MFQELMPLLRQRAISLIVSATAVDELRVNVIPIKLKGDENDAVTTPLTITGSPTEIDAEFPKQLVEFVGNHLGLASTLKTAAEQLKAAAR
jgi:PRTRC genetic system protein E